MMNPNQMAVLAVLACVLLYFAACTGSRRQRSPKDSTSREGITAHKSVLQAAVEEAALSLARELSKEKAEGQALPPDLPQPSDEAILRVYEETVIHKIRNLETLEAFKVDPHQTPATREEAYQGYLLLDTFRLNPEQVSSFRELLLSATLCEYQNDTVVNLCLFSPEMIVNADNGLVFEISPGCRQIRLTDHETGDLLEQNSLDYQHAFVRIIDSLFFQP